MHGIAGRMHRRTSPCMYVRMCMRGKQRLMSALQLHALHAHGCITPGAAQHFTLIRTKFDRRHNCCNPSVSQFETLPTLSSAARVAKVS